MWSIFTQKIHLVWQDPTLRRRLLFAVFILGLFRLGAAVPVAGVDPEALGRLFASSQFLGLLNIFSGGGLENLSIVMLGVGPFITASIVMQLLTVMFPSLKELYQESGELGRKRFAQYSRLLTVPLAAVQGLGLLALLKSQGLLLHLTPFQEMTNIIVIIAGSVLLMWLGELINEYGVGNGVSLIIFAGIVAGLPTALTQVWASYDVAQIPVYLAFLVISILTVAGVVFITEAERPIPVTYAKQVRGMKMYGGVSTYLPIRLNQAGVMPIIFALSLLLFPRLVFDYLSRIDQALISQTALWLRDLIDNLWFYSSVYFVLVFAFTYFYSAITFDPQSISTNLQKNGAFIPGIRPGRPTADYLTRVITRLTLVGGLFLGVIALLPLVMRAATGVSALAIGGTGLLIVVSVSLELVKQIDSQISMREY